MATNIFENETSQSAVQTIRESMSVSLDDNGTPLVAFAMNRGKGSGAQVMPVADFGEYVSTLQEYAANGIDEIPTENLSPAETVRHTIALDDDNIISFRVRSGKGAKPAKVAAGEFEEVASLLRSTVEAVEGAASKLCGPGDSDSDGDYDYDDAE